MSILTDIAGRYTITETPVDVTAGSVVPLAQANPARYAIGFGAFSPGQWAITTNPSPVNTQGFTFAAGQPVWFNAPNNGPLPMQGFFAHNGLANTTITVWEVIDNMG